MGYEDRVWEKISSLGHRRDERLALWQSLSGAFQAQGADGVKVELLKRMDDIRGRFRRVLEKLEGML